MKYHVDKSKDNNLPLVSIIILNYNGRPFLDKCLSTVLSSKYLNMEVIFVDNSSNDSSVDYVVKKFGGYSNLKIVVNDKNYGFAKGNNIGAKYARGKYLVFLNNDTMVDPLWLNELVKVMESDPKIGAAQCKIRLMHSPEILHVCGHLLAPHKFVDIGFFEKDKGQYDNLPSILSSQGAALAVRRDLFFKVQGFDKFLFSVDEDIDLCWRIWLYGYKVVFVSNSIIYHAVGGTLTRKIKDPFLEYWRWYHPFYTYRNRFIVLMKNLELVNLIRYILSFLTATFCEALINSVKQRKGWHLFLFLKALFHLVAKDMRVTLTKRRAVSRYVRRVKDSCIMPYITVDVLKNLNKRY